MNTEQDTVCDLLLTNGSVITVDDERHVHEPGSVAIGGDRILAVGTPEDLDRYRATRVIDCTGKAVLPGFVDTHTHMSKALGGAWARGCRSIRG